MVSRVGLPMFSLDAPMHCNGMGGVGVNWNMAGKVYAKRAEMCAFYSAEVTAQEGSKGVPRNRGRK